MKLVIAGVFDAGGELRHQALLGIEDIPYSGCKGVGESSLLENVQIGPEFQIIRGVFALHPAKRRLSVVDPQAEDIPLPANLKGKIAFFRQGARIVGEAGR